MSLQEVLAQNEQKDLLRFLTCGSVDDGKSTLIGRLLHDSKEIYDDQLKTLKRDSKRVGSAGQEIDFSLLLDGLKAEREQGITIDVAYRYFSTPRRKFIIADCPGHEQYTRNMATGASTANLAIVLVDARHGVVQQTKRHSFIASLLDIGQVVVAINKMDLVDYSQEVYERIRKDYTDFAARLDVRNITFIPISALCGDNVVDRSDKMPWFGGAPLLEHLETVHIASDRNLIDMRFPVQYVLRRQSNFRGFCGTVASGILRSGAEVVVLPSGRTTQIKGIHTFEGQIEEAFPPMAVTISTEDEVDISRGDVLVHSNNKPQLAREFDANMVWLAETPLDCEKPYVIKHGASQTKGQVAALRYRFDINSLGREAADSLALNEIGRVKVEITKAIPFDSYKRNRATGSFIVIDPVTNGTVGAGMILDRVTDSSTEEGRLPTHVRRRTGRVTREQRMERLGQQPVTLWLTGLPKAGKSTIAFALERLLFTRGRVSHVLDGENLRLGLSENLGFSALDRSEHIRRSAHVAKLFNDAGLVAIVALVSPYRESRDEARAIVGADRFVEVHVDCPVEVCARRDPELYDNAKSGQIARFTGVSSPYQPPENPDVVVDTSQVDVDVAVDRILAAIAQRNLS